MAVRRFVIGWVGLLLMLGGISIVQLQQLGAYYQRVVPVSGGIYNEGMVGLVSNVNPIYASSDVDRSISRLVFAGLLRYNNQNELVGALAKEYTLDNNGKRYTVTLKRGLTWHDGKPITADDVLFTFNTIKNPDARSPLFASWQNVSVKKIDQYTIEFSLSSALAPFPYNLTTGIIPKHILGTVDPSKLRSAAFNTQTPIGAGPFSWRALQVNGNNPTDTEVQVALLPFESYVLGTPEVSEFIMHVYRTQERLIGEFKNGKLTAMAGLDHVPTGLPESARLNNLILSAGTYVFFNTNQGVLESKQVRNALVNAADPEEIVASLGFATRRVNQPLLAGQLAHNQAYAQQTNNPELARQKLQSDGWKPAPNGVLQKDTTPLSFSLLAIDTPEYRSVAAQLKEDWKAIGVRTQVDLVTPDDFNAALASHSYSAVLYGVAIGQDPDVYAYWDSSQADIRSSNRLNFSEWSNGTADAALRAGRTRVDPEIRTVKYEPFLKAWRDDAPALGLYQPRYIYITRGQVYGLTTSQLQSSVDRFDGIRNWQIRTAKTAD